MRFHVDVVVWRGAIAESRHRVQAAVCGADGSLFAATATPELITTFRSSAKPFQLLPLVERGHATRWGWSDEQLAVMAASHTGSAYHVALVRGILARIECTEQDLACGYHPPLDPDSRAHLATHPGEQSPVWNNCSGKHAGMLCLARSEGWPLAGYERADHPLQQLMRRTVAEVCGLAPADLTVAVDGCSVSVFGMPLARMARGYARFAAAAAGGDARERALARIRGAMAAFPVAVTGEGRFSTRLMQATAGRMVAKGGAEGLECVAIPALGLGLALKCEDGSARGAGPATLAVLDQLDVLSNAERATLAPERAPEVSNYAGLVVGRVEAAVRAAVPVAE
jgi:L-asparaginase II